MSFEIGLVLAVLATAVVLFVTEWVRVDVVALIVLVLLALTGLVEPKEALSGFSNPAVITVWAVFILSGGLAHTGIASLLGRQVLRLAAGGEIRLIATLADLHFREKYGLNVVAISRAGEILRSGLRDEPLFFGDALLLHGAREKLKVLAKEPDFLVLTEAAAEPIRSKLAPVSALLMAAVVGSVVAGLLPIYIAAVCGALLMVLSGCLTMDEAYRAIEWRAVFLIAGMLPMGIALEQSGAAAFLTTAAVGMVGDFGPRAIVTVLFLTTALAAQVMPTAAVAILMAPIALNTAVDLGLSPEALLMAVALSASASFMSPVAHPANTLIMGPGGYRFVDYIKVGLPLTLVCLATVLLLLPLVWPLRP